MNSMAKVTGRGSTGDACREVPLVFDYRQGNR